MPNPERPPAPVPSPRPPEEDYELATPEEIATRRRRKKWLAGGVVAVLLAFIAGFAGRPTVRAIKSWQARRTATEALRLLEAGKPEQAVVKVQDALSLRGNDPEVMRVAATFLTRVGHGREAVAFWKEIEKGRSLTGDEQRDYATDLLIVGDPVEAGKRLRVAWPDATPGTPADWYLGMQLAARERNAAAAVPLAKRLVDSSAAGVTERQRMDATLTLLSVNDPSIHQVGETALRAIADGGKSPESLEAVLVLAKQVSQQIVLARGQEKEPPPASMVNLLDLADRIEKHPQAKTVQRLLAIQTRIIARPEQRETLIRDAMARYGTSKDNEELASLGAWLYAQGEFERLLEVITPARSIGSRGLYLQFLDALGALGRWEDIRRSIEGQRFTLEPMVEHMYLARCATQLNHPETSTVHWNAALLAAGVNLDKLLSLGRYALGNRAPETAEAAFRAAVKASPENRPAHEALLGVLESEGRTRDAREAIRAMLAIWSQDTAVRNDDAYLGALLGEDLPADRETARDLLRTEPMSLPHRITLALAEFRLGHALTAMEILQPVESAAFAIQPRFQAVRAALLWETHYDADAVNAAKGIPRDRLLPEERELLKPLDGRRSAE